MGWGDIKGEEEDNTRVLANWNPTFRMIMIIMMKIRLMIVSSFFSSPLQQQKKFRLKNFFLYNIFYLEGNIYKRTSWLFNFSPIIFFS